MNFNTKDHPAPAQGMGIVIVVLRVVVNATHGNQYDVKRRLMKAEQFDTILKNRMVKIGSILGLKAKEYAQGGDRLHNFKIAAAINDLIEHFENGKYLKQQSCWAGSIAADKWEALFEK